MIRTTLAVAVALGATMWTASASADEDDAGYKTTDTEDGYAAIFDDDPLGAGVHGSYGYKIRSPHAAYRTTLIRPRTNFVTELIKSVEQIGP